MKKIISLTINYNKMEKPIFKWAWEKINTGDYTDIKSYNAAMKEYNKLKKAKPITKSK